MNKRKKIKILLSLIIIAIFSLPIIISKAANADIASISKLISGKNIGKTIDMTVNGTNNIHNNQYIYCFEKSYNPFSAQYTVKAYVEIEENQSTSYKRDGTANDPITDEYNAMMAYILSAGNYAKGYNTSTSDVDIGERQFALWLLNANSSGWTKPSGYTGNNLNFSPSSWLNKVGSQILDSETYNSFNNGTGWNNNMSNIETSVGNLSKGIQFLNSAYDNRGNKACKVKINWIDFGKFRIDYSGALTYKVYDLSGNLIKTETLANGTGSKTIEGTNIGKIEAQANKSVHTAKIWFLYSANSQNLVAVDGGVKDVLKSDKWEGKTTLTLNKKDKKTNANIQGAGFKLVHRGKWAIVTGKGPYTVTEWVDNENVSKASTLTTNSNGQIVINIEKDPNTSFSYAFFETTVPKGYSQGIEYADNGNVNVKNNSIWDNGGAHFYIEDIKKNKASITLCNTPIELTITKKDENTNKDLTGAQFVIWEKTQGWLTSDMNFSKDYSKARIFEPGTYERVPNGNYFVFEIKAPDPIKDSSTGEIVYYDLKDQEGYMYEGSLFSKKKENGDNGFGVTGLRNLNDNDKPLMEYVLVNPWTNNNKTSHTQYTGSNGAITVNVTNKKAKPVKITKIDEISKDPIANVGIKVLVKVSETNEYLGYNSGDWVWLTQDGTQNVGGTNCYKVKTSSQVSNATEFKTNGNGEIWILNQPKGTYYLFETSAREDENYYLSAHEGYKIVPSEIPEASRPTGEFAYIGSKNTGEDRGLEGKIPNSKSINISGYVWVDTPPGGKETNRNDLYDSSRESRVSGVTVKLMEKGGQNNPLETVTTGDDGSYKFNKKVAISKLNTYYVEFDYTNTKYNEYRPVAFNATAENGSKALTNNIPTKDSEFVGIATTYPKNDDNEKTYGLSALTGFINDDGVLEYVNLGLRPIYDPTYLVAQNIEYAKIKYDRYSYKYNYGGKQLDNLTGTPLVNWGKTRHIRYVYPSELTEQILASDKLEVYVVYKIVINNEENKTSDDYTEKQLVISQLVESKIDDKYTLYTDIVDDKDSDEIKRDIASWTEGRDKDNKPIATYKNVSEANPINIAPNGAKSFYIQFKVNNKDLQKLLINNPNGDEPLDTKVEATPTGHHIYESKDYAWNNNTIPKEGVEHITEKEEIPSPQNGLIYKLPGDKERTIEGTVFKDKVTNEAKAKGEVVGNGEFDSGEDTVEKVTVQLYKSDGKTVAPRYPRNSFTVKTKENGEQTVEAKEVNDSIVTTVGGKYSFVGVLPGEYIVRFTYGDGTEYDVKNYKSTIVSENTKAKDAFKNNGSNKEWYKEDANHNYSVAVDNLETREKINEGKDIKTMDASTPLTSITIENSKENEVQLVSIAEDGTVNILGDGTKPEFEGFNFGIIEQPKTSAEIKKVITNVKLTNAQNNILFNGNPQNDVIQGVTDLDGKDNGGSTFTRIELNEESIYGSEIELKYQIRVTNKSDVNYCEIDNEHYGWYYLYGEHGDYSRQVVLQIDDVVDYLDPTLTYTNAEGTTVKKLTCTTEGAKDGTQIVVTKAKIDNIEKILKDEHGADYKYNELLDLKGMENIARGKTKEVAILSQRLLSTDDKDMEIINLVEIANARNTVEKKTGDPEPSSGGDPTPQEKSLKLVKSPELPDPAEAVATITPPTGEDRNTIYIYAVAGIIALASLATGLVIIKKKIL